MIQLAKECVVTLAEASRRLPRRRKWKRPNIATLYRWAQRGVRGAKLETLHIGGTRCTSHEALARFFERLTFADDPRADRPPNRRQRAAAAVERELRREGV